MQLYKIISIEKKLTVTIEFSHEIAFFIKTILYDNIYSYTG